MALRVNSFFCFDLRSGCLAIAIAQVTLGILGLAAGAESGDYVGSDVTLAVVGFLCGLLLGAAYYKKSGILFILWLTFAMISIIAECIFAIVAIALVTQSNTILAVIPIILLLHIVFKIYCCLVVNSYRVTMDGAGNGPFGDGMPVAEGYEAI